MLELDGWVDVLPETTKSHMEASSMRANSKMRIGGVCMVVVRVQV